jgi:uncharacterized Zn finger protein (UPF0148 family)
MAMTEDERKCPVCESPVFGRSDKVYCSRACRRKVYVEDNRDKFRGYAAKHRKHNKSKIAAKKREWRQKNKIRIYEYNKQYREKKGIECRGWSMKYYNKMKSDPGYIERRRKLFRGYTEDLRDSYVKRRLCRDSPLTAKDIPQSLIDAKREHLRNLRYLKEQENE